MSTKESKGMSLVSRRWKVDIKETVNNYNFKLHHVHGNGGKCNFCGNKLVYVATITGDSLLEGNTAHKTTSKVYDVGLDCLQLVLGEEWVYFRQAKREIAKLKKEAAQKKRAEKYATQYKDMIAWFDGLHPEYIKTNKFLSDMFSILTTGRRVFTPKMEKAIRSKMAKIQITAKEYGDKLDHHRNVTIPKIKTLLNLVKEVDGITNDTAYYDIPKWSAYDFVTDVLESATTRNFLSPKQREALNKVHVRYTKKKKEAESVTKRKELDTSNIPY